MFDLTETPERAGTPSFDQFYTNPDGSHWVHSSLFIDNPRVDLWLTTDALVKWYPGEFTYSAAKTDGVPFPTFIPQNPRLSLVDVLGWVNVVTEVAWGSSPLKAFEGYVAIHGDGRHGLPNRVELLKYRCDMYVNLYLRGYP